MAQSFVFRGLSCADVHRVHADADALEALVGGARPGLLVPSSVQERTAAAHRAARLAPRHGSDSSRVP